MTTMNEVAKTCALCGEVSQHVELMSSNTMGPPDLDTRPAEMMRSTIGWWVQRCPCGYCSRDISQASPGASDIIELEEYQTRLADPEYPELARSFIGAAMIEEKVGDSLLAAKLALEGAWACDDSDSEGAARRCRLRAIELFRIAEAQGQRYGQDIGVHEAIMADLYRRSGGFDEARQVSQEGLELNPGKPLPEVLQFQLALIEKRDDRNHSLAELNSA